MTDLILPADREFRLFSAAHNGQYLFVSNDTEGADRVVEAHPFSDEGRNSFRAFYEPDFRVRIYHPATNTFLFVSNDMAGGDHIVEAHSIPDEERNLFEVQFSPENRTFALRNTSTRTFLFLSNDQRGSDYVIEAHGAADEARNIFAIH